jgi:hypothetical protein
MFRDRKDLLWIFLAATLILVWGSIPTWAGRRAETPSLLFRGIYFDEQDYAVHIATMQAGIQGAWAYKLRFTTEPHRPAYLRIFYVVLGHVSGWLRLDPERTYHLARWLLGYAALFSLYSLFRRIFPDRFWARLAFLFAALGAGLGWLQLITGWIPGEYSPVDFWLIDAYVLFSLSLFPHFAFVTALMCTSLSLWLAYLASPRWQTLAWIALSAVGVQLVNPIAFALVDAALVGAALFSWWSNRQFRAADLVGLLALAAAQIPLLAYNFSILNNDPIWSQFTVQNATLSPGPLYYVWGFALFWPPALLGGWAAFKSKSPTLGAALAWILAAFALAYAPFNIQRRFLHGITIPLSILATQGLIALARRGEARPDEDRRSLARRKSLAVGYVLLASVSSIYLSLGQMKFMQTHPAQYFYPAALGEALDWLKANSPAGEFVLGAEQTGSLAAQKAGMRTFLGHPMETLAFEEKQSAVEAYYQGKLPDDWLDPAVQWVFYGPYERALSADFQAAPDLELMFENEAVRIYAVK